MGANPAAGCNNKEEYGWALPLAGGVAHCAALEAARAATAAKGECNMCPIDPGALAEDPTGVQGEVEVGGEAELDPGLISGLETGLCGCGGGVGVWGLNRGFDSLDLRWDAIMSVMILLEDELHFDLFSFVAVVILLVFSFSSAGIKIEEAISFTTCSKTAARISSLAAWS